MKTTIATLIALMTLTVTGYATAAPAPVFEKMTWQEMVDTAQKAFQDNFDADNPKPAVTACAKVVRASGLAKNGVGRSQIFDDYPGYQLHIVLNDATGYTGCKITAKGQ